MTNAQTNKVAEIIAAAPDGAKMSGPIMIPACSAVFVDATMPNGGNWRFSVSVDGRVTRNRKMLMSA